MVRQEVEMLKELDETDRTKLLDGSV